MTMVTDDDDDDDGGGGGGGGGGPLSREKSRDVLEQPPPILAKARRLQLADASFRDKMGKIYLIQITPMEISLIENIVRYDGEL